MEKHIQILGSGLTRLNSGLEDYPDEESYKEVELEKAVETGDEKPVTKGRKK